MAQMSDVAWRRWLPSGHVGARLWWQLRRAWRWLGWAASAGLLCTVLALALGWQARQASLRQPALLAQLAAWRNGTPPRPASAPAGADLAQQLAAFYAYLPPHAHIPDQVQRLIALAGRDGVALVRAEYKPQPEANAAFLRYRITLPVKADYPHVQRFLLDALRELPALTVESVAFKRERIEQADVEARIELMLLVQAPLAKVPRP